MWINNCRLLGGNVGWVWWGTRPMLGSGDQRLIPGIRPVSRDMGEKPIVWDIWGSGRNKKWDPVFSSHDSHRNSYILPWRSYVIVGCLRTNMLSDNEAYRICRTQGFYFTHQEPFHSDGWVPTFSLTQKTLNDVPLIMSHPQIKMIAQRVHFYIKQTTFKASSQSHVLWAFAKYFHPWCGIYCVAGAGRRLNYLSI